MGCARVAESALTPVLHLFIFFVLDHVFGIIVKCGVWRHGQAAFL